MIRNSPRPAPPSGSLTVAAEIGAGSERQPSEPSPTAKRNHTVDYLRGLAAVLVCVCHFRHALPAGVQGYAKTFGELGVQVFFVISGYIIPYSLHRGNYRGRDFWRFWWKRLLRLQPTYWAAIALTFGVAYAAGAAKGVGGGFDGGRLLAGMVYLHVPPENPVIWTLIIELKYYLFVSLLFPWLFSARASVRRGAFLLATAAAFVGGGHLDLLRYLPFFLIGFAGCHVATRRAGWAEGMLLAALAAAAAGLHSNAFEITAGLITCGLILYLPASSWKLGMFYGAISYSLYLIHFPVGVKLLNLVLPHTPRSLAPGMAVAAVGACTAVAYGMFRLIEKPSSDWSQAVRLSPKEGPGSVAPRSAVRRRVTWSRVRRRLSMLARLPRPLRLPGGQRAP